MPSQKGYSHILILLIVSAVVGSGVFYIYQTKITPVRTIDEIISQPPTPSATPESFNTEDWQTYTNTKYGFSLKMPQNWAYYESEPIEQGQVPEVSIYEKDNPPIGNSLNIKIHNNLNNLSPEEYIRQVVIPEQIRLQEKTNKDPSYKEAGIETFNFEIYKTNPIKTSAGDGIKLLNGFISVQAGSSYPAYYVGNNEIILEIFGKPSSGPQEEVEATEKEGEKIISTIEFSG